MKKPRCKTVLLSALFVITLSAAAAAFLAFSEPGGAVTVSMGPTAMRDKAVQALTTGELRFTGGEATHALRGALAAAGGAEWDALSVAVHQNATATLRVPARLGPLRVTLGVTAALALEDGRLCAHIKGVYVGRLPLLPSLALGAIKPLLPQNVEQEGLRLSLPASALSSSLPMLKITDLAIDGVTREIVLSIEPDKDAIAKGLGDTAEALLNKIFG